MRTFLPGLAVAATVLILAMPWEPRMPAFPDDSLRVKREVAWRVARNLTDAIRAWREWRLERCIERCDELLRIDPDYAVARDLRAVAQLALGVPEVHGRFTGLVDRWARSTDADDEAVFPHTQDFRFPSSDRWRDGRLRAVASPEDVHPDLAAIRRKLAGLRIDLELRNTRLEGVLTQVRDYSGLPILLDAEISEPLRPDRFFSVSVRGLPVGAALAVVLAAEGSGYRVRVSEDRFVLVGR